MHHRLTILSVLASVLPLAVTDPNSVCISYGVDFEDEGHYFINKDSNESFTCVSRFSGCNDDLADVLLVDPNGDEHLCTQVGTVPENTPMLSTCPILKNQMLSGDWMILILGNNDDGNPFAWERDLYLDVGTQATTTSTPTVTFTITSTPTVTMVSTSTSTIVSTVGPFATTTLPSATAKRTKTVTPKAVTTTATKTFTRLMVTWTNELKVLTKTVTATCTTPTGPGRIDKPCTYTPTMIHAAAMETPTAAPKYHRYVRKADRAVDFEYARRRIEAAKLRRDANAKAVARPLEERAPDAPTITLTASTPVNATVTESAAPVTTTESTLVSTTSTSTLPPVTIYSGIFTNTVTAPTPTRTRFAFAYTTSTKTVTVRATFTHTLTLTPSASITPCRALGGHYGPGML